MTSCAADGKGDRSCQRHRPGYSCEPAKPVHSHCPVVLLLRRRAILRRMKVALSVVDFVRRAEDLYPSRVGVVDEPEQPAESWGSLTYAEIAERARAQAAGLDALGIGVGERVAVVSQNSARLLTSFFGVSGSGRILVPINFRLVAEEVKYIVGHCGARVLIIDPELAEGLAEVECEHRFVIGAASDAVLYRFGVDPMPWEPDEDATATINYTSGTTARPKGVQMTHRNLWLNAAVFGWQLGISDRDVYLHTLPQFHCNGWGVVFSTTGMGARHIILRKIDGAEILRRVEQHGVTIMCAAPAVLNAVLDAAVTWDGAIPGRDRVRIVVAGAPPPTKTIERCETELGWEFIQIYGLTETAPLLTMNRRRAELDDLTPTDRAKALSRAGGAALGIETRVDENGEIIARGNHIMAGYWEQPQATADAIHPASDDPDGPDWFHTGDGGTHRRRPLRHHLRPEEGRDHLRRGERQLDRGRGRHLRPSGGLRGRRDRRSRREVGRAGHGPRGRDARAPP